jgi:hypothetical protein
VERKASHDTAIRVLKEFQLSSSPHRSSHQRFTSTLATKEPYNPTPTKIVQESDTMADLVTPRITAQYLENFQHQTIRMVGKVTQLRGEQATIDAGGSVSLTLNRVSIHLAWSLHSIVGPQIHARSPILLSRTPPRSITIPWRPRVTHFLKRYTIIAKGENLLLTRTRKRTLH